MKKLLSLLSILTISGTAPLIENSCSCTKKIMKKISNKSVLLNTVITNSNLGEFQTENLSNPTEQQIKDKLKKMYPNLDITKIKVENISNNRVTINSSDTNIYTGNVIVNYTFSINSLNW